MSLDEKALEERFLSAFDVKSNQVLTLNKPSTKVDKSKPWVRFSVSMGARQRQTTGPNPTHLQLGGVYLQVFVPKSLGVSGGDSLIQKFDDLFCDWQSEDGAIEIKGMSRDRSEEPDLWQHTIRFAFQSKRVRQTA